MRNVFFYDNFFLKIKNWKFRRNDELKVNVICLIIIYIKKLYVY